MLDQIIIGIDRVVNGLLGTPVSVREHPDANIDEVELTTMETKHVIGLMRVNHCGEVCAQGLYQGQALFSRNVECRDELLKASMEEVEHLAWTKSRIEELGGRTSILNPLFYLGSIAIGATASLIGDKWSMGFLAATEDQVEQHLESHLEKLPESELKSRAILLQMRADEIEHAKTARRNGAEELPDLVKNAMRISSQVMTKTTYYL